MVRVLFVFVLAVLLAAQTSSLAQSDDRKAEQVFETWYQTLLELVRHTPTYSPPVASRSFAYLGVTAYEAVAGGSPHLQSLSGQLNGFKGVPAREAGKTYDEAIVLAGALSNAAELYFDNTGPSGQQVIERIEERLRAATFKGVPEDVAARSYIYGEVVAHNIYQWSKTDGGAEISNLGFPMTYNLKEGPGHWKPTSVVRLQQAPLLPAWGNNRTFAMPMGNTCKLSPPPAYSEDKSSDFYKEALAVYEAKKNLSDEQKQIARFWSDDPMLSPTPPGHWVSILLQIIRRDQLPLDKSVETMARLGIAVADGFIGCWQAKFEHDLLRPVTYIKRVIDKTWEPLLITPPFPEYPSGHSTQSGAAAEVLIRAFGKDFAFEDETHIKDGIKPRKFSGFWAAAEEAGMSRFYGGIHFMSGVTRGLEQGVCIGTYAVNLKMRK